MFFGAAPATACPTLEPIIFRSAIDRYPVAGAPSHPVALLFVRKRAWRAVDFGLNGRPRSFKKP
jgi:hypothetical protein